MAEIKVGGLEGVKKALRGLTREAKGKELYKALRPGAKLIQQVAIAKAPQGDESFTTVMKSGKTWNHEAGQLRKSIAIRRETKKYITHQAQLRIGVLKSSRDPNAGAWYWRFVEFGTVKQPAQPFLVPAFESSKYAADGVIKGALLKMVERLAKKHASKSKK